MAATQAKYHLGQVVRHKKYPFRGVIFDVDPTFDNTDEWYEAIPEDSRPIKEQPFYHLLAEAPDQPSYVAYVSQQNLLTDEAPGPLAHPLIEELFDGIKNGKYISRSKHN